MDVPIDSNHLRTLYCYIFYIVLFCDYTTRMLITRSTWICSTDTHITLYLLGRTLCVVPCTEIKTQLNQATIRPARRGDKNVHYSLG